MQRSAAAGKISDRILLCNARCEWEITCGATGCRRLIRRRRRRSHRQDFAGGPSRRLAGDCANKQKRAPHLNRGSCEFCRDCVQIVLPLVRLLWTVSSVALVVSAPASVQQWRCFECVPARLTFGFAGEFCATGVLAKSGMGPSGVARTQNINRTHLLAAGGCCCSGCCCCWLANCVGRPSEHLAGEWRQLRTCV